VLSLAHGTQAQAVRAVVAHLRADLPDLVVAVGGAERDRAPRHCLRLDHQIGAAAAQLASQLTPTPTSPSRVSSESASAET
jgi:hypothetical protein